ncbi:hypothetical protein [Paramicrobacterium chengjingii]|uniref:Uncharacterized protein n=1 Tax=Paramicrobacterium chengjingii TaxID=2769067 RepID=A0ABX6YJY8_9MICO|nr:hypothetical protein [Microbacterium chengjingii]QPZ39066.1 hypothetical protein HCR76_02980 [Microbacterium chengjingii]
MTQLNDETASAPPAPEHEQPVWNGVDADFSLPEESHRGWFGRRRRRKRTTSAT